VNHDRAAILDKLPRAVRKRLRRLIHARSKRDSRIVLHVGKPTVGEPESRSRSWSRLDVYLSNDTFDVGCRRLKGQTLRRLHVELPAKESDSKSLFKLKTVAHDGERLFPAAVHDFQEDGSARLLRFFGLEVQQIAGKLDHAVLVYRREVDVGDASISGKFRINLEIDTAFETLVRSLVTPMPDVDTNDFSERRLGYEVPE
jgi:hypothetical protein